MPDFQFNIAKGQMKSLFNSVEAGGTPRIIVVPLEVGTEDDDVLNNYTDLATLLAAAANNEQTTMGRKTLDNTGIELAVNNTTNKLTLTLSSSITWAAATGNPIEKLLFCYDPDPGDGDADIIPLLSYDFLANPSGIDIIVSAHANGLIEIS